MDNKITKERVNIHLEYDWIKYVAALLASVFIFALLYTTLAPRLKIYEEIKFMLLVQPVTDTSDESKNELGLMLAGLQKLYDEKAEAEYQARAAEREAGGGGAGIEDDKNQGSVIQSVTYETMLPGTESFAELLTTRLISNFDFVIAPEQYFSEGQLTGATIDFADWKDADGVPYIDTDAGDEAAQALGFKDSKQFKDALYGDGENGYTGFKLNGFDNISRLFLSIKPLPEGEEPAEEAEEGEEAEKTTVYVMGLLAQGGNIGNLNGKVKKKETTQYNEALDALIYFNNRYSGKAQ